MKERAKTCYFDPGKEILSKPAPGKYDVKEEIVKSNRFSKITLGLGSKMLGHYSFTKREHTPGPGDYSYENFTDLSPRSRRSIVPLNKSFDLKPQHRECSFAVAHSGEPFTAFGEIDKSPKIKTPLSY